jgi:hypothetical protein
MIEGDEIGKRAADIDGNGVRHSKSCLKFVLLRLGLGSTQNSGP